MLLPGLVPESALLDGDLVGDGDFSTPESLIEVELDIEVEEELVLLGLVELDGEGIVACEDELCICEV